LPENFVVVVVVVVVVLLMYSVYSRAPYKIT
jgi:hypothetical protein